MCAAENKVAIAAAGAIDLLIEMLRSPSGGVRVKAVDTLYILASKNCALCLCDGFCSLVPLRALPFRRLFTAWQTSFFSVLLGSDYDFVSAS